ncbi:hypothetical protein DSC45_06980 [Streptomyces sp. YIM 130001]|uniref:hypothetical protein n=1 Tax=Streptomyces sp. YIM 130001 TaxID=2259644 RepID=UPI000E6499AF|nr:hypothetical protein [Streptomyces sp. YIM 130001]RII19738.1 hypothetical protein DSC45_06980 [Streptomyces sp. YIM 130001]
MGGVAGAAFALVVAAGVTVPLMADGDGGCARVPASAKRLGDDPAAATKALDPGDDLARLGAARRLLGHGKVCDDGAEVLGRAVTAATVPKPGRPLSPAQARASYAVVQAFTEAGPPDGTAPYVARMLASQPVDTARQGVADIRDPDAAVYTAADLAGEGRAGKVGRFLHPDEAHPIHEYEPPAAPRHVNPLAYLTRQLARDPEAFAILYDAERAHLAHYLERLDDRALLPGRTVKGSWQVEWDLKGSAERIADLLRYRYHHAQDGGIEDPAAFDRAVRRQVSGAYAPSATLVKSRPPMADSTRREPSGKPDGDLFDGRHQILPVLDDWARDRGIPRARAESLHRLLDSAYVQGWWLR